MNRLSITVQDVNLVLTKYNEIKVYRSSSSGGPFVEITAPGTRLSLLPEDEIYWYLDSTGNSTHWYTTSYYNSDTADESVQSTPMQGGTEADKIGFSFGNYEPPPGEWGKVITADDMRYTYMWGVDATAQDVAETDFEDSQFDYYIEAALNEFEAFLTTTIRKRVLKTNPDNALIRSVQWRNGVDYTDEEEPYEFDPSMWSNYGFIRLRKRPVLSLERAVLYGPTKVQVVDILPWARLYKSSGQVFFYPKQGSAGALYGPYGIGGMPWRMFGGNYPDAIEIDYTVGYPTAAFVPAGLREAIGKWACIKCLNSIGDGLLAGFSSQSVSLDGLSESFSSTQSATSAYFGARILQYQKELQDWMKVNRYKYSRIPMAFVGV